MTLDRRLAPARAVPPGGAGGRVVSGAGDATRPPVAQSVLALQRLAGNRATEVALGRASARALQRLVLTTEEPPKPTDSLRDIANKHEVERAAKALAGAEEPSYIMDWKPDLDAEKVNYVVGHSGGEEIGKFTVEELADLLVDRGMKDGMVVRLVACKTGLGNDAMLPLAARLAIHLNATYGLNDFAVKGAKGILIKTRRKKDESKDGPDGGVTGVYEAKGLPHVSADLGRLQFAFFDKLATHLYTLITTLDVNAYRTINSEVLAIFDVFEAGVEARDIDVLGAEGKTGRKVIAELLGKTLREKFSKRIYLSNTDPFFTPVINQIRAIAATEAGKTILAADGGSKSFARLLDELTRTLHADSEKVVEDWFAAIPKTATKVPKRGNVAYRFGTPNPELFPKSYVGDAVELAPVDAESDVEDEQ